VKQIYVRSRKL